MRRLTDAELARMARIPLYRIKEARRKGKITPELLDSMNRSRSFCKSPTYIERFESNGPIIMIKRVDPYGALREWRDDLTFAQLREANGQ